MNMTPKLLGVFTQIYGSDEAMDFGKAALVAVVGFVTVIAILAIIALFIKAIAAIFDKTSKTAQAPVDPAPAAPAVAGEGEKITSPMPGNIIDIKVNVGDNVKKGQVVMILEAMKMENEIMAGADGQITSIAVTKGASVQTGDMLCTIK